jgi:hypothetical protein
MVRDEAGKQEGHPLTHSTCLLCLQGILQGLTRGNAPWGRDCLSPVVSFSQHLPRTHTWWGQVSGLPEAQLGATLGLSPFLGPSSIPSAPNEAQVHLGKKQTTLFGTGLTLPPPSTLVTLYSISPIPHAPEHIHLL